MNQLEKHCSSRQYWNCNIVKEVPWPLRIPTHCQGSTMPNTVDIVYSKHLWGQIAKWFLTEEEWTKTETHFCIISELRIATNMTDENLHNAWAELQRSITTKDAADHYNAKISHIRELTSEWITIGQNEAEYHAEDRSKRRNGRVPL